MVTGTGIEAKRFAQYASDEAYLIFASGVFDSTETRTTAFEEETEEVTCLLRDNPQKIFVYFSTCSIYDETEIDSPYVGHKLRMENMVRERAKRYLILRLPQVAGPSRDDNSLLNYLVRAINEHREFAVWANASRNLIDIDDIFFIVHEILANRIFLNKTLNIAAPRNTDIQTLVAEIERFLGKQGNYYLREKGGSYRIPIDDILPIAQQLNLDFGMHYTQSLLAKYYGILKGVNRLISVVVPTYFAEEGINEFYRRTKLVLDYLSPRYRHEIIFVNDGSLDNTTSRLIEIANADPSVRILDLSRNFGNQLAITAGIDHAQGDAAIIIDDDLQDPPEIILSFVSKWEAGYDVVYGVRMKRRGVNPIFKIVAKIYYRIIDFLSETKIPVDTGDFRLIDGKVMKVLQSMREESRYYRGLVAWTGFRQLGLLYNRDARYAGSTNFTLVKYLKFGFTGITSFSDKPLYFASYTGLFVTLVGFVFAIWISLSKIINPSVSIPGWTSLSALIIFFGGVQLLSIGILGLYISKIFRQVKERPLYITKAKYGFPETHVPPDNQN